MSIDTIGDFLTIIRNGIKASALAVEIPYSRVKYQIAQILKDEGYIRDVALVGDGPTRDIKILLKYVDRESVIHAIQRVSRPGRRVYEGYKQGSPVIGGLGVAIITTNRGIMTNKKARQLALGGEVICAVW